MVRGIARGLWRTPNTPQTCPEKKVLKSWLKSPINTTNTRESARGPAPGGSTEAPYGLGTARFQVALFGGCGQLKGKRITALEVVWRRCG